jgi:hypothetical protein
VIEKAEKGESISVKEVKAMIDEAMPHDTSGKLTQKAARDASRPKRELFYPHPKNRLHSRVQPPDEPIAEPAEQRGDENNIIGAEEIQRQAWINVCPSDWAEFKRRSDAHGQSAAAALGQLVQQHLGAKANGRPEPTISNPVAEVNGFHRELVRFSTAFSERFTAWLESQPVLDDDGKAALMQALYLCAEECNELAQKLDGR